MMPNNEWVYVVGFAKLEGIRQADAVKGRIGGAFALCGMIGIFDIDGGDIVGQQDYFIGVQLRRVFAWQGCGRDETAFHHAGKEGPRAGKGIEHMHIGIG